MTDLLNALSRVYIFLVCSVWLAAIRCYTSHKLKVNPGNRSLSLSPHEISWFIRGDECQLMSPMSLKIVNYTSNYVSKLLVRVYKNLTFCSVTSCDNLAIIRSDDIQGALVWMHTHSFFFHTATCTKAWHAKLKKHLHSSIKLLAGTKQAMLEDTITLH